MGLGPDLRACAKDLKYVLNMILNTGLEPEHNTSPELSFCVPLGFEPRTVFLSDNATITPDTLYMFNPRNWTRTASLESRNATVTLSWTVHVSLTRTENQLIVRKLCYHYTRHAFVCSRPPLRRRRATITLSIRKISLSCCFKFKKNIFNWKIRSTHILSLGAPCCILCNSAHTHRNTGQIDIRRSSQYEDTDFVIWLSLQLVYPLDLLISV